MAWSLIAWVLNACILVGSFWCSFGHSYLLLWQPVVFYQVLASGQGSRHVLGLFQGMPGAKRWRRYISENAHLDPANAFLLEQALEQMTAG